MQVVVLCGFSALPSLTIILAAEGDWLCEKRFA
jgi:hypothetical protein